MKVNQHRDLPSAAPVSRPTPGNTPAAPAATTDFAAATKLAEKLAATPEVRPEAVARAKALIVDPNYPNTATIKKVARRLTDNIQPPLSAE